MTLSQDGAYAVRMLRRSPIFTATAILSLAIGIAGNASIFSLADTLLLRQRPGIARPQELVDLALTQDGACCDNFSYRQYVDLRDGATVFSGLAGYRFGAEAMGLGTGDAAERVFGSGVSGNYFTVLGVGMTVGRGFLAEEDRPGIQGVVVMSHHLWQQRFDATPSVIGQMIRLNGRPFTVVGVAGDGFAGNDFSAADLWIPLARFPETTGRSLDLFADRQLEWVQGIGRLRTGVTLDQARSAVELIHGRLQREYSIKPGKGIAVSPSHRVPREIRPLVVTFIGLLFALVGLILLIACTNVAGMMLARSVARTREVAMRAALGASRGRIVRELVIESVLLSITGAAAGLVGAVWMIRALDRLRPSLPLPLSLELRLDWRVVVFSLGLSLLTGVIFGLVPALQAARADLTIALKADALGSGRKRLRLRQTFVVAQIAMSVLLVVSALLLARSLWHAGAIDPGFTNEHVDVVGLDLRLAGYGAEAGLQMVERILARVEQLPRAGSAAFARVIPLTGAGVGLGRLHITGDAADAREVRADWNVVTPRYFDVLRISLVKGRLFNATDRPGAPDVAIVNETLARRAWPDEDAIGRTLMQEGTSTEPPRLLQVIGVARDGKYRSLGEEPRAFIYVPLAQQYSAGLTLFVRRDGGASLIPEIRTLVHQMDSHLPIVHAASLEDAAAIGLLPGRLAAWIAGGFSVVGLLLAAIGLYGLMAYNIAQRTREIGVRIALGATRYNVLRLVVGQGMRLTTIGVIIGLAAAAAVAQLLRGLLYGTRSLDPVSFASGTLVFCAVAVLASWLPVRRAISLSPVDALKSE